MRYNPTTIRDNVLHDILEGVMVVDMEGVIALYNPACAQILGVPFEQAKEKPYRKAFQGNSEFINCINKAIRGANHAKFVTYNINNSVKHLRVTSSKLKESDKVVGMIFVIQDDTELLDLKEGIKDIKRAKKRVEHRMDRLEGRNEKLATTFAKYMSVKIMSELLDHPEGTDIGGSKAQLTVLMSDLRGFTALSEHLSPQDLLKMLNHFYGEMTEITSHYGGTIIDFAGDGMMVLFGAPITVDNHAESAVAAAIAMQAKMQDVNDWNVAEGLPPIEMGIGISTGDMVLGNIGSDRHAKYGVVGNQVNLCSRIESYTVGGEIYISPQTKLEIQAPLHIIKEKSVMPKGKNYYLTISLVNEIGEPYNVSCPGEPDQPEELSNPITLDFMICNDKHCDAVLHRATITHLNNHCAIMETAQPLEEQDELILHFDEEVTCKVVDQLPDSYFLRFTSIIKELKAKNN